MFFFTALTQFFRAILSLVLLPVIFFFSFLGNFFFQIIPTMTYHPQNQIDLIQNDLGIQFENYQIIDKSEDWFGFDQTQNVTFELTSEETALIEENLTADPIKAQGVWKNAAGKYTFTSNPEQIQTKKYSVEATLENNRLHYRYLGF